MFELEHGVVDLPDPLLFVELLDRAHCPRLECVFLNGCKTIAPLGEMIAEAHPHTPTSLGYHLARVPMHVHVHQGRTAAFHGRSSARERAA